MLRARLMMYGEITMRETVLRLKPGVYRVSKPMHIGSMRLVGARNFVVFSAVSALYRNMRDLFVPNSLKKNLIAPAADVTHIAIALEYRADEVQV
jgi:hypothetical protein